MVDLLELSPLEIGDKLTSGGLEVESVKKFEDDTILELKVTPNRPDALSHMGIARELAAILKTKTTFLPPSIKELGAPMHDLVQLNLIAKDLCPRYACRVIEGVQVAPSPEWLQKKLLSINLKPINNIVDATNWILFERGQPLHAFDLDTLAKSKSRVVLRIRMAEENEKLVTLDGKERILKSTDLVIADDEKAIALAGIMGGKETEVSNSTQNILLESAYFDHKTIRKTAKRLGLSTDASYRFERGTDPNGVMLALDRAAMLITEIAGGRIRRDAMDVYPKPIGPLEVSLRPQRLAQISSLPELDPAELRTRFLSLGIETAGRGMHDALKFRVPTFRPDITEEIDLIEEAMRLIGFDQIPDQNKRSLNLSLDKLERHIKIFLSQTGFHEAINYSFGSPKELNLFKAADFLTLENPLGEEYSAMRQSLFPGLLNNVRHNLRQQAQKIWLFETGVVFWGKNPEGQKPDMGRLNIHNMAVDAYANEKLFAAGILVPGDFFALKGILENLFESLKVSVEFKSGSLELPFLHPGQSAYIYAGETCLGFLGFLHPDFKQESAYCVFSLDLGLLQPLCFKTIQFKALPKFPGIQRDLALIVDEKIPAGDILSLINDFKALESILESSQVFDVYQGKGIEAGKKSVAVSITMRKADRTLTEEEVNEPMEFLQQELANKLGAVLR
jgi:phenylalanyl-tRNA synthetase beta chain